MGHGFAYVSFGQLGAAFGIQRGNLYVNWLNHMRVGLAD